MDTKATAKEEHKEEKHKIESKKKSLYELWSRREAKKCIGKVTKHYKKPSSTRIWNFTTNRYSSVSKVMKKEQIEETEREGMKRRREKHKLNNNSDAMRKKTATMSCNRSTV